MENSSVEQREGGGANSEINEEEAELTEEKTHSNLKGAINGATEAASGGEKLQNGDRGGGEGGGGGGGGIMGAEGGGDLSSINAMMSAVMSAAGTINGGGGEGGSGVTSGHSSAGPSPSPSPSKTLTSAMRAPPSRNARRNQDTKDDGSSHICPLCDKSCGSQHQLTMHIRQHNADTGATDHSCSICGKCLSSASSLDRHMLVHSGERPYKCNICGQTFTTNGNMHRHMKIHEKDPASGLLPVSPPSPTKRRRPSVKRRQGLEEENGEEPPSKKVVEDPALEESAAAGRGAEEELLPCPICFKTCSSRLELDAHMDTHPDTALRCDFCCLSFRTHRGLLRHNAAVHKILPQDPSGRPFIQNNPSIPTGFNDLAFIDFSCKKFAHIAQVWCETNLRRCISKFHRFVCDCCDKAFPLRSALDLHKTIAHHDKSNAAATDEPEKAAEHGDAENVVENDGAAAAEDELLSEQASFLEGLGLQHITKVKSGPTEDEIHQAHLDSIKVIHVEPPCSSLPQEPASAYLSGGLGLTLGLGVGGLAALSIPLLEGSGSASALQGLSQRDALSLLTLQPFQAGFLVQPDGGAATASPASSGVKPSEAGGGGIMELADIQQILKVATAAPNQMGLTLPPLAKAPGFAGGQGQVQSQKAMPPLKPKPPMTPRSSLIATTPPPLHSSQQASLGCISPSLPPPTTNLFKTPSSSSSSAGNGGQMDAECMAHTPLSDSPPAATTAVHDEAGLSGRKPGTKGGNNAKGSFPCRFCDQVFTLSSVLQAHMRFHLGIVPHQCNICEYVAPDKATLIRHLRTHSGERPYVCRVCHYPFTVKANCERHLRKKHAKTSRKDIEKNIKYVTSTTMANITADISAATATTQDTETGCTGAETTCRFCSEDLKTYRALQIHLRTHNGCQRKPFECRRCGAAFLAKRNCIHHLLKQHPEVQEREIEDHIATLLPAAAAVATVASTRTAPVNQMALNGIGQPPLQAVKVEDLANVVYPAELDQPLDFSSKSRGAGSQSGSPGVKLESVSPSFECSSMDQPIDLSIPSKRQRREAASTAEKREIKTEQSGSSIEQQHSLALSKEEKSTSALPPLHHHPQLGCYQLPSGSTPPPACLPNLNNSARPQRLKPLLPKPANSSTPSTSLKELPPLASIAQIIHSVSGAPDLLKRDASSLDSKPPGASSQDAADAPGPSAGLENDDTSEGSSRKRTRKKTAALAVKEKAAVSGGSIDLESSGEFASVEKMLATTDTNKFSTYLQTGAADLGAKRDDRAGGGEEKEGVVREEGKLSLGPQSKGKKNAYSNSVQKMTCPYCPRVFPWASSLQRHMLTHTGQKPFPCPQCDAVFSTKSNCERHLLRKHGVTNRTLRRNGALVKKDGDDGSHESAESQSETEQVAAEAQDLSAATSPSDSGSAPITDQRHALSEQLGAEPISQSPTHKPSQGCSPSADGAEQLETETTEQPEQQEAPESRPALEKQPPQSSSTKVESTDDDDCHSNKSLDLNFGKKLIDFKLSTSSSAAAQEEQPSQPASSSSSPSAPQTLIDSPEEQKEKHATTSSSSSCSSTSTSPVVKQQPEYKHVCRVCKKSFRYATTLARHERAHLEDTSTTTPVEETLAVKEEETESNSSKPTEEEKEDELKKEMEMEVDEGGLKGGESEDSGESEEDEKEKEERSDEEASEPKSLEGGDASGGGRVDKRKKICNVCGKRFWSLQDLTRHMRSHTGERPYKCQTCERTFTLKHSLVRHQRIHLKPRGADGTPDGTSTANDDGASEDGDSCTPTPTSTCPPSENESECGSGTTGGKDLEEAEEGGEEGDSDESKLASLEEQSPTKLAESESDSAIEPVSQTSAEPQPASDEPDKDKYELSATQTPTEKTPSQQATDTKTTDTAGGDSSTSDPPDSNVSKDPCSSSSSSSSSSPPEEPAAAAPAEGFIQGLLEIHAKPPLEHILPNGEPPLVGVD